MTDTSQEWFGFQVEVDPTLPPGVVEFRHADGSLAGRITMEESQ